MNAGERVGFLALIDTGASANHASAWQRLRNRLEILRHNPRRAGAFAREAAIRPSRWMMNRVVQKLLGRGVAVPPKIIQRTMRFHGVSRNHVFGPYAGTLTLFCARNGLRRVRAEQDLGWGAVGVGKLEIIDVDGDHETMLKAPDVQSLGGAMRNALAAARRLASE